MTSKTCYNLQCALFRGFKLYTKDLKAQKMKTEHKVIESVGKST